MLDRRPFRVIATAFFFVLSQPAIAGEHGFAEGVAKAAEHWLTSMGNAAENARFPFIDDERFDWNFTPRSRQGVPLKDMNETQRVAAKMLMRSTLSSAGILKAEAIMALEAVLHDLETWSFSTRDPENYLVSIFGKPGIYPWGWRFEGHHLSVNVTLATAADISVTPIFTGTNPARIPSGPRAGQRVQLDEFILALRLARTLSPEQMAKARIDDHSLGNIVAGPGRGDALKDREGLPVSDLSPAQLRLLRELIYTYVGIARGEIGQPYMKLVEAGLNETRFAWAGHVSEAEAFYYRIHGPRILIEFDNTQNDANHIHAIWRDPENDFGRDDLKQHYNDAPIAHGHRP